MKKIILTGATGFIGWHSLPFLLSRGYEVHAVTSRHIPLDNSSIQWHTLDLLNPDQVGALVRAVQPTHILHLAWYTVPGRYWTSPENLKWVKQGEHLAGEFKQCGGKRIVTAGTCAEYDWSFGYCSEEVTPIKPVTLYGEAKDSLHMRMDEIFKDSAISSAWGRLFFPFGPGEHPSKLVSSVVSALLQGNPALVTEGRQVRDYLYIEDVAEAFVQLLDSTVTGPVNIGSGTPVSIREIIELIGEKTGHRNLIHYGGKSDIGSETPTIVADNRRLLHEVGWRQKHDMGSGIDKTISWWRAKIGKSKMI
jgi:nucleoside-diphosphate-sugar epimerase